MHTYIFERPTKVIYRSSIIISMARIVFSFTLLLLFAVTNMHGRILSSKPEESSDLVSDGVDNHAHNQSILPSVSQENLYEDACVHVYGFLPCADNVRGYIFQVFVFGCLLIGGDYLLFQGSTKLFRFFGVGIYGGFVMQLLLMFPRITLMLSNGFHASQEVAQSMVLGSVGFAVGYTVFGLTLQWGACVIFGCMDISNNDSNNPLKKERSIPRHLSYIAAKFKSIDTHSSVKPDPDNRRAAKIMIMSFIPFIMVQLSVVSDSSSWSHGVVLITLIFSISAVVSYFVYQFLDRSEQQRRLEYAVSGVWNHMQSLLPKHLPKDGEPNLEDLETLFKEYDTNNDGKIYVDEIKNVMHVGNMHCNINQAAKELIKQCDKDNDGMLDKNEFFEAVTNLLVNFNYHKNLPMEPGEEQNKSLIEKLLLLDTIEAVLQVIIGALIVIFLARPLMMNIELLSSSVGIPSFFITFVVIPLARNLKQALSARICNPKRKQRIASLKFSQIYGDVTMNNILSMLMILAIICARGLTWDYSAEVFILLVIGTMIGVPAVLSSTYPFWISIFAFSLYPFSLLLIYVRFYVLDLN